MSAPEHTVNPDRQPPAPSQSRATRHGLERDPSPTYDRGVSADRLRVFVSHSAQSAADRRWLKTFVNTMTSGADAVDVLYDRERLTPGSRWRSVINHMIAECQAAVVLITPSAL